MVWYGYITYQLKSHIIIKLRNYLSNVPEVRTVENLEGFLRSEFKSCSSIWIIDNKNCYIQNNIPKFIYIAKVEFKAPDDLE